MSKGFIWYKSVAVYSPSRVRGRVRTEASQISRRMRRNFQMPEGETPEIKETGERVSTPRNVMEDPRRRMAYKRKRLASRRRRTLNRGRINHEEPSSILERNTSEKKDPEERAKQDQTQRQKRNEAFTTNRRKGPLAHVKARIDTGITNRSSGKSLKRTPSYVVIEPKSSESIESESHVASPEPKEEARETPIAERTTERWKPPEVRKATSNRLLEEKKDPSHRLLEGRKAASYRPPQERRATPYQLAEERDASSHRTPEGSRATSYRQPEDRDASSHRPPEERRAIPYRLAEERDASSHRPPEESRATPYRQPEDRDASSHRPPEESRATPYRQPEDRDASPHRPPEERRAIPYRIAEERDASSHRPPKGRRATPYRLPEDRDALSHRPPEESRATPYRLPEDRDASSHRPPEERRATPYRLPEERDTSSHRPPEEREARPHRPLEERKSQSHRPLEERKSQSHRPLEERKSQSHRPLKERKAPSRHEFERRIDFLVSSLASMMPACRSVSQIDDLVGCFADAFRNKVVEISAKDSAKTATTAKSVKPNESLRKPVPNPGSMEQTAQWVAQCTEIAKPVQQHKTGPPAENLRAKTFNMDDKRHPEGSQTFRKQNLLRNYGEMCILRESGDRKEISDSDKEEIPEEIEEGSDTPPRRPQVRYTITNPNVKHVKKGPVVSYHRK